MSPIYYSNPLTWRAACDKDVVGIINLNLRFHYKVTATKKVSCRSTLCAYKCFDTKNVIPNTKT